MSIQRIRTAMLGLTAAVLMGLAACGGSGAGAGGTPEGALSAASLASSISLNVDSQTINSDLSGTVQIVATVKDANNVALANQSVSFSTPDRGATLSVASPKTDDSGTAAATLAITDPSNREIVVTATSGSTTGSVKVQVVGSSLAISVGTSSPTINSDMGSSITVVATVKDGNNVAKAGQTVVFSTTDSGATLGVDSPSTDGTGAAFAKLSISDATNRDIVVKATAGSEISSTTLRVVGSAITISGASSISFGADSAYTVALKNSASVAVVGSKVTLKSSLGNVIAPAASGSDVTDGAGQARFTIRGGSAGEDTLTAAAHGVSGMKVVEISGSVAAFETLAPEVDINSPVTLKAKFFEAGVALPVGSRILFSATRGALAGASALTDAAGVATMTIESASAGITEVTATAPGGTDATAQFEFVSRTPDSIWLQGSPTTIPVNLGGSSASTSTLLARVRDLAGNPVKGVRVDFSAVSDPSNGRISPPYALTDSAGIATTSFLAGPNSSGHNLVKVRSRIASNGRSADAELTVAAQALSVRIHTGSTLETPDTETYLLPYVAVVSDAAGNPVSGAAVTVSYVPTHFYKGKYTVGSSGWIPSYAETCTSEDSNGNGVLDQGEDRNIDGKLNPGEDLDGDGRLDPGEDVGNGTLDPGYVATAYVVSTAGKTDSSGFATLAVKYPRGYANWAAILLQVTITAASGTETVASTPILLPALAADLSSPDKTPPGGIDSRFGVGIGCDNAF